MSLLEQFQQNWKEYFAGIYTSSQKILLAVSGGLDSCVMTDLFYQSKIPFAIAHCNFLLRGEESDADAIFVKHLAEKYHAEFFLTKFDTKIYASQNKLSIEEAARNLRYEWFLEILKQNEDLICIATAHHADDNVETVLHHFFRGTGLKGLLGIPMKNEKIIRPLLFASKKDLQNYFKQSKLLLSLGFRTDKTNFSEEFTRNAIRLNIVPEIEKVFPDVKENIFENIKRLQEVYYLYNKMLAIQKEKLIEKRSDDYYLPILLWKKSRTQKTLLWEFLKTFSFTSRQIPEVQKLMNAENGSYINSKKYRIFKNRNHLILTKLRTSASEHILIEDYNVPIHFTLGVLHFFSYEDDGKILADNTIALLDEKEIRFPLLLRKWKLGDYFYPLGMNKKKKLSKFFIDNKLSLSDKENVWVLESDKRIIWIVGYRIDERFKIKKNTTKILKIVLEVVN